MRKGRPNILAYFLCILFEEIAEWKVCSPEDQQHGSRALNGDKAVVVVR